jgi:hypothetical protein
MDAQCNAERRTLLERFRDPLPPRQLIELLRKVGVDRSMIQKATGAKSPEVVGNWAAGRSAAGSDQLRRLDSLRVVVSFLLSTNALDDDGLAIAMWLNAYPAREPFVDGRGRPSKTPLEVIRADDIASVVDAAQEWIDLRGDCERYDPDNHGNWTPA